MITRDNSTWVAELRVRNEAAIVDLRDRLLRNLRKAILQNPQVGDAFFEDAVQDSILRILERLDQFECRSEFLTWSTSIAVRVAIGELRRSRWKDVSLDELVANGEFVPQLQVNSHVAPDSRLRRTALLQSLRQVMNTDLTEKQRSALLAELQGMPQDEIARHLGSNRNAIYKLTHDARKKLKASLEAAGYSAEDLIDVSRS